MEPGFYRCESCHRSWSRQEFKLSKNPPRECPHCGAGEEAQKTDARRESSYVKEVYGSLAKSLLPAGSAAPRPATWIQTRSGLAFDLADPSPSSVNIEDIARSLSQLCRYAGHTRYGYSVAEHSCHVADMLWMQHADSPEWYRWDLTLQGLLHDAHEAYTGDLIRPLQSFFGREFSEKLEALEESIWEKAIGPALGLPPGWSAWFEAVRKLDSQICIDERNDLLGPPPFPWGHPEPTPVGIHVECWSSERAANEWLERFHSWTSVIKNIPLPSIPDGDEYLRQIFGDLRRVAGPAWFSPEVDGPSSFRWNSRRLLFENLVWKIEWGHGNRMPVLPRGRQRIKMFEEFWSSGKSGVQ